MITNSANPLGERLLENLLMDQSQPEERECASRAPSVEACTATQEALLLTQNLDLSKSLDPTTSQQETQATENHEMTPWGSSNILKVKNSIRQMNLCFQQKNYKKRRWKDVYRLKERERGVPGWLIQ